MRACTWKVNLASSGRGFGGFTRKWMKWIHVLAECAERGPHSAPPPRPSLPSPPPRFAPRVELRSRGTIGIDASPVTNTQTPPVCFGEGESEFTRERGSCLLVGGGGLPEGNQAPNTPRWQPIRFGSVFTHLINVWWNLVYKYI